MNNTRHFLPAFAAFLLLATPASALYAGTAAVINTPANGLLEGNIVSKDGMAVNTNAYTPGVIITATRRGTGDSFQVRSDPTYGGLYRAQNVVPGIYDISVPQGMIGNTTYSPETINGVVVNPGVRTNLDITMYSGHTPLVTGTPERVPPPAPVAQQLSSHDQLIHQLEVQVDDLRKQINLLNKQVADLQARQGGAPQPAPAAAPPVAARPAALQR